MLGYNMGKADLTNLFIEGQKVSLEAVRVTPDDRKKYPGSRDMRTINQNITGIIVHVFSSSIF